MDTKATVTSHISENVGQKTRRGWTDTHGLVEKLREEGPMKKSALVMWLEQKKKLSRSDAYYQVNAAENSKAIKCLEDGHLATADYNILEKKIEPIILREVERNSSFFADVGTDYPLRQVAVELGLRPTEIEAEFYRVAKRVYDLKQSGKLAQVLRKRSTREALRGP